jgi:hypothetical protein
VSPQRGRGWTTAFPSPVVILSILAVTMAAVAFVATRGQGPAEREVALPASATPTIVTPPPIAPDPEKQKPAFERGKVYVEVYNNSGVQGLAGQVATKASSIGWQVVGSDNWYGTIPASTVYYPERLRRAARQLALDLGIKRVLPAVDPMRGDRLTVILTAAPG